jgi:tetratricopeptide (TPR) repeat protein
LKAFLSGEQFYRRGVWDSAAVYYDQAITQDSTFAIAFKQMAAALSWFPSNYRSYLRIEEYGRKAVVLNRGLSPKDSMQIAADSFDIAANDATDPADLIRFSYRWFSTLEEAAHRYPEDPEVVYRWADAVYHSEPPLGGTPAQALEIFDQAIAIDPGFAPAYEHTVESAIRLHRPDLARKYAAAYLRLDSTAANAPATRLAAVLLDSERSHTPEAARAIDSASTRALRNAAGFGPGGQLGWGADSGEAAIRLLRELITRTGAGATTDSLMDHQFLANALAYRGHLHEAYETDRRLILDPKASRFTWWMDPFMCLALLGVIPDSLAASTYAQAFEPDSAWPIPRSNIQARHLRGLPWWQARKDTLSLARFALRAEQEGRTQKGAIGKLRGRYLHAAATAYLKLARGDSAGALRLFQSIPDTLCVVNICYYEKLIEARLLASEGRARQAGEVLDLWVWRAEGPLHVLAMLDRARIAESLGEREKALQSYQFVVDVWRGADPQLQPFVVEARTALTRMSRELP